MRPTAAFMKMRFFSISPAPAGRRGHCPAARTRTACRALRPRTVPQPGRGRTAPGAGAGAGAGARGRAALHSSRDQRPKAQPLARRGGHPRGRGGAPRPASRTITPSPRPSWIRFLRTMGSAPLSISSAAHTGRAPQHPFSPLPRDMRPGPPREALAPCRVPARLGTHLAPGFRRTRCAPRAAPPHWSRAAPPARARRGGALTEPDALAVD